MNAVTAANLNRAIIFAKVEEKRVYDEAIYLLAVELFKKQGTISSRMIREEFRLDHDESLKIMERIRLDNILSEKKGKKYESPSQN